MSPVGRRVENIENGRTGKIAEYGHTDDMLMVIWDETGGASLWSPEKLRWLD